MAASSISRGGAASPVPMRSLLARRTVAEDDGARREGGGVSPDKKLMKLSKELRLPLLRLLLLLLLRSSSSLDRTVFIFLLKAGWLFSLHGR